jgi:hypothetical protein
MELTATTVMSLGGVTQAPGGSEAAQFEPPAGVLLEGELTEAVAELKSRPGRELQVR